MEFEGIFITRDAGDTALGPCRVRVATFALCDHSYGTMPGSLERETQTRDSAADHDKIELLHAIRRLSISRVLPMNTARARMEFGRTVCSGCKVSASIKLT